MRQSTLVSISIPAELRRAMLKFRRGHKVNWSKVACTAFRAAMQERDDRALGKRIPL